MTHRQAETAVLLVGVLSMLLLLGGMLELVAVLVMWRVI